MHIKRSSLYPILSLLISKIYYVSTRIYKNNVFQARRMKAIAEDPAIAAEAAKQPPEEDDEKDEIDDEIIITHL